MAEHILQGIRRATELAEHADRQDAAWFLRGGFSKHKFVGTPEPGTIGFERKNIHSGPFSEEWAHFSNRSGVTIRVTLKNHPVIETVNLAVWPKDKAGPENLDLTLFPHHVLRGGPQVGIPSLEKIRVELLKKGYAATIEREEFERLLSIRKGETIVGRIRHSLTPLPLGGGFEISLRPQHAEPIVNALFSALEEGQKGLPAPKGRKSLPAPR